MPNIDLRGIDPNSMLEGLKSATDLILKICGGEASKFSFTQVKKRPKIRL